MDPTTRDAFMAAVILLVLVCLRRRRTGVERMSDEELLDAKRQQTAKHWNGQ